MNIFLTFSIDDLVLELLIFYLFSYCNWINCHILINVYGCINIMKLKILGIIVNRTWSSINWWFYFFYCTIVMIWIYFCFNLEGCLDIYTLFNFDILLVNLQLLWMMMYCAIWLIRAAMILAKDIETFEVWYFWYIIKKFHLIFYIFSFLPYYLFF